MSAHVRFVLYVCGIVVCVGSGWSAWLVRAAWACRPSAIYTALFVILYYFSERVRKSSVFIFLSL